MDTCGKYWHFGRGNSVENVAGCFCSEVEEGGNDTNTNTKGEKKRRKGRSKIGEKHIAFDKVFNNLNASFFFVKACTTLRIKDNMRENDCCRNWHQQPFFFPDIFTNFAAANATHLERSSHSHLLTSVVALLRTYRYPSFPPLSYNNISVVCSFFLRFSSSYFPDFYGPEEEEKKDLNLLLLWVDSHLLGSERRRLRNVVLFLWFFIPFPSLGSSTASGRLFRWRSGGGRRRRSSKCSHLPLANQGAQSGN